MGLYNELKWLTKMPYNTLCKVCKANYSCAYGDNYSVTDIRKSVQNNKFVIIKTNKANELIVGENPDTLIVYDPITDTINEIEDSKVTREWDGEAIIIDNVSEYVNIDDNKLFIYSLENSDWDEDDINKVISYTEGITIGDVWLPQTPVILQFKRKTQKEIENDVRGMSVGVEITLYDSDNPLQPLFHELGHIYWRDVMDENDRNIIKQYYENLDKENLLPIYTSRWVAKNPEEAFCTLYMWYLQGQFLSSGYKKILKYHDAEGYEALMLIFDNVAERMNKDSEWDRYAAEVSSAIEKAKIKKYYIKGKGLLKAYYNIKPKRYKIPEERIKSVVRDENGIRYVLVKHLLLRGKVIPINEKNYIVYSRMV